MKVIVTGGTGLVGRFICAALVRARIDTVIWSRRAPPAGFLDRDVPWRPFQLGAQIPSFVGADWLLHCAFDHVAGRYRGGEGEDPAGFWRRNVEGSLQLVEAAHAAGCRTVFLSSRAVYGAYPPGTVLTEATPPSPDTLYGEAKLSVEGAVAAMGGVSLRATGVYGPPGPGQRHKWDGLFADFAAGQPIAPRRATEVHGADLAAACLLALQSDTPPVLNVSDIMLDRRTLLSHWSEIAGITGALPDPAPLPGPAVMDCTALRALGWRPEGMAGLRTSLIAIAQAGAASTP